MARRLSVDELLDRAEEQIKEEYPNSDPSEVLAAILRYRAAPSINAAVGFTTIVTEPLTSASAGKA